MKIASSLKSLKKRDLNSKLVRRRGRVYIINKKNPKFKARQKQFLFSMIIGSLLENKDLENRIAITPDLVKKYISAGFETLIEEEFGVHLGILDNEFTVKRFVKQNGQIILKSENPKYRSVYLQPDAKFEIWGVVTRVIHKP